MIKKFLVAVLTSSLLSANAQNVGVGTATPQATLDVKGNLRTGGISNFVTFDTASGKIIWTNSNLWVTNPQYIMKHSASAEGLYSNGSQLEYRNSTGNPAFYTNWNNGNGYFSGNLGIGTTSPTAKLQIKDGASGITPFFSARMVMETNSHTYINLLSPDPFETGILFGSGTDAVSGLITYNTTTTPKGFTFSNNGNQTRMVITGTGNVGIGTTAPIAKLQVNHDGSSNYGIAFLLNQNPIGNSDGPKIQFFKTMNTSKSWTLGILNGVDVGTFGISEDAGIGGFGTPRFMIAQGGNVGIGTANPNAPLSFPAFLGKKITLYPGTTGDVGFGVAGNRLQIYSDNPNADVAIGYDASGTFNERFAVKPNGALAVNSSTGNVGDILQSNGSGSAASWVPSPKTKYYQTHIPLVTLTNASSNYTMTVPVTVSVNSIITVSVTVTVSTASYAGCPYGELLLSLEPLGGGGLVGTAGYFQTTCGSLHTTFTTGEIPIMAGDGSMKIFTPGTGIGAIIHFTKNNTGPDLTIGDYSPAVVIVKVVPQ